MLSSRNFSPKYVHYVRVWLLLLTAPPSQWYGRMLTCRPLRCAGVPAYDGIVDSPIHVLSFRPIPMVVGALMLTRWIVQNGASETTGLGRYLCTSSEWSASQHPTEELWPGSTSGLPFRELVS